MDMANLQPKSALCPRILVVDDDADQRDLIVESLQMYFDDSQGNNVSAVGSATECLALDLKHFNIVLLDYNLPDSTGLDLLKTILSRADVPVIFVTGENVVATAAEAIQQGAQDYVVKLGDYLFTIPVLVEKNLRQHQIRLENNRLQMELQKTLEEVRVKNLQLEDSLKKLNLMATTDHLTGLANRRHFGEMLDKYFGEAQRYQFDLACIMLDVDHYKTFNDSLGHQMGDKILIAIAQSIADNLRSSDLAARYGGDEFVILLPHTSIDLAITVAQRIREQVAAAGAQYLKVGRALTMSIGVASLVENHAASADMLVSMADQALYASKDGGRDRITTFAQLPAAVQ